MLVACEILNAWSGVDVLVLALIASIIEIKSFVQFMIGDKCDLINTVLARCVALLSLASNPHIANAMF